MAVERESSFGDEQMEMRESQNEKRKKKWKLKRNKTILYLRRERMRARAQHTNGTQHQLLLSIILLLFFLLLSSCDIHIASFRFEKVRAVVDMNDYVNSSYETGKRFDYILALLNFFF